MCSFISKTQYYDFFSCQYYNFYTVGTFMYLLHQLAQLTDLSIYFFQTTSHCAIILLKNKSKVGLFLCSLRGSSLNFMMHLTVIVLWLMLMQTTMHQLILYSKSATNFLLFLLASFFSHCVLISVSDISQSIKVQSCIFNCEVSPVYFYLHFDIIFVQQLLIIL